MLLKDNDTVVKATCFYLIYSFFKEQKEASLPGSFSA